MLQLDLEGTSANLEKKGLSQGRKQEISQGIYEASGTHCIGITLRGLVKQLTLLDLLLPFRLFGGCDW